MGKFPVKIPRHPAPSDSEMKQLFPHISVDDGPTKTRCQLSLPGFEECGGKVLEMGLTRWEPWRMVWLIVRVVVEKEGRGKG